MLSKAQKLIVQEVCQIQIKSLEEVFMKPDLGTFDEEESYEQFFESFGASRKDFDKIIIEAMEIFKKLKNEPEEVFKLDDTEMLIFRWILFNFKHIWEDYYPKALENLWNKLFLITINDLHL